MFYEDTVRDLVSMESGKKEWKNDIINSEFSIFEIRKNYLLNLLGREKQVHFYVIKQDICAFSPLTIF